MRSTLNLTSLIYLMPLNALDISRRTRYLSVHLTSQYTSPLSTPHLSVHLTSSFSSDGARCRLVTLGILSALRSKPYSDRPGTAQASLLWGPGPLSVEGHLAAAVSTLLAL